MAVKMGQTNVVVIMRWSTGSRWPLYTYTGPSLITALHVLKRLLYTNIFIIIVITIITWFYLFLQGGGAEKVKEEKRQSELEDSYRFVWNQNSENENNERTDSEED